MLAKDNNFTYFHKMYCNNLLFKFVHDYIRYLLHITRSNVILISDRSVAIYTGIMNRYFPSDNTDIV